MALIKFSKGSRAVIKNKQSFFNENEKHLAYVRSVNDLYKRQPARSSCKTCEETLGAALIKVHGISYAVCSNCGHFNGLHEDTRDFAEAVYNSSDGRNYSSNYRNDYANRVAEIYRPKVEFLTDALHRDGLMSFSVTDVGCGGGHFVAACEELGISCIGYDPNIELVKLGSQMLSKNRVVVSKLDDIADVIRAVETPVVSLIGVLEHLMNPLSALQAFRESRAKYLYLQVPLFSFSVLLESANPDVFPRQLNAGHTHLYTHNSLTHLQAKFGLSTVGEWWFGTDMVDLFRHILIKADIDVDRKGSLVEGLLGQHIDEMQAILDKSRNCSGVNLIWSK